jgi:hypothetical protein
MPRTVGRLGERVGVVPPPPGRSGDEGPVGEVPTTPTTEARGRWCGGVRSSTVGSMSGCDVGRRATGRVPQ